MRRGAVQQACAKLLLKYLTWYVGTGVGGPWMRVSALLLQSKNNHKSSAKQITDILRIIKEVPGCEYAAQLPKTCKILVNVLSRYSQTPAYRYDLCPNATCTMVYRNQYKSARRCPKCNTSRHPGKGRVPNIPHQIQMFLIMIRDGCHAGLLIHKT